MLKNILNLEGTQLLSKKEQKNLKGGFFPIGGVPIASTCDYRSLQSCANSCTAPNTVCGPCLDNNSTSGTYECRYVGTLVR